ncbi:MAG: type II secretion system F family protein [Bacilli bacterium]
MNNVFIFQTIIILILALVILCIIIFNKALSLERRISKYSVDSLKSDSKSLFDRASNSYFKMIKKLTKVLKKSKLASKYSRRYSKYISYDKINEIVPLDYISNKIIVCIMFIIIIFFAKIIEGTYPNVFELLIAAFLGFFIIDIFFMFSNYAKKKQIEQDLLNAIIIMNNAFRSGRSTMQAIEIVANELKGPIQQEFKKMHLEISYGLSLDTVFERFNNRVALEEVSYITSSLTILNKTGGNIIKVFSSIEKMLFNKKKLKQEMKALTSSSTMISRVLLFLPFAFITAIYFFDNSYFDPLFTTTIGRLILLITIVVYLVYVFIVNRVMKVRF